MEMDVTDDFTVCNMYIFKSIPHVYLCTFYSVFLLLTFLAFISKNQTGNEWGTGMGSRLEYNYVRLDSNLTINIYMFSTIGTNNLMYSALLFVEAKLLKMNRISELKSFL